MPKNRLFFVCFEVAVVAFELFIIYGFLSGFFERRQKAPKAFLLPFAVTGLVIAALSVIQTSPLALTAGTFLGVFFIALVGYEGKIAPKIRAALLFCVFAVLSEVACFGIVALVFKKDMPDLMGYGPNRLAFVAIAKLVQILLVRLMVAAIDKRNQGLAVSSLLPLLLCQIVSIYIVDQLVANYMEQSVSLGIVAIVAGVLYINLVIFWYIEKMKEAYEIRRQKEAAESQLKAQIEYYEDLRSKQEETRSLWHDINKHMRAIENLVETDHRQIAAQYMEALAQTLGQSSELADTNNPMVNAVLNEYMKKARNAGIKIDCSVGISKEVAVNPADLAVIIGNTLENAIDACEKLADPNAEKKIELRLFDKGDLLFYEIANPYEPHAAPQEGKEPEKKATAIHGYGLENVKRMTQKYSGHFERQEGEGIYKISILLNLKTAQS
ncbi:MAG: GHKL domain-containing protein [Clostridiales bacterium]|jgi:signal transduction histidine kinase|nr:GHKL domain-containing protein [Clostridiales bacterium]